MKESLDDKVEERSAKEDRRAGSNLDPDNYITGNNSPIVTSYDLSIKGYLNDIREFMGLFNNYASKH